LDLLGGDAMAREVQARLKAHLSAWLGQGLRAGLAPLYALAEVSELAGPARGLAFQLGEGLGLIDTGTARPQIEALTLSLRRSLDGKGVRFGRLSVFLPALLKPAPRRLKALLWAAWTGGAPLIPPDAAISRPFEPEDARAWRAVGFLPLGVFCIRADKAESLALQLDRLSQTPSFTLPPGLSMELGLNPPALLAAAEALGYLVGADGGLRAAKTQRKAKIRRPDLASPFAILKTRAGSK